MSALANKLLKDCRKYSDNPKPKLDKKLLAHKLELAELLPLVRELADTKEKQQRALALLVDVLAPEASNKKKQGLESQLQHLGLSTIEEPSLIVENIPTLTLVSDTSAATKPYKKNPCSSCPALSQGLCRCALKRARTAN